MATHHENTDRLTELFEGDRYARSLGVELVDWDGGTATVAATPGAEHTNFLGTVHGGFLFSAADVALGVAANSWGRQSLALSIDIKYLTAAATESRITFVATEVNRSRSIGTYRLDVHGEDGSLVSTAVALAYRTRAWHFGDDAWPEEWRATH
ncbi:MAG: PaaI family thioesterase [Actinomycetota bacterium]